MRFQSGWSSASSGEIAVGAVMVLCYAAPLISFPIIYRKRMRWGLDVVTWRQRTWVAGLMLGVTCSLIAPLTLLGIQVLPSRMKSGWFINGASTAMFVAFLASAVAMVLLGFGRGRVRWFGLLSAGLTLLTLFVSLLAFDD